MIGNFNLLFNWSIKDMQKNSLVYDKLLFQKW